MQLGRGLGYWNVEGMFDIDAAASQRGAWRAGVSSARALCDESPEDRADVGRSLAEVNGLSFYLLGRLSVWTLLMFESCSDRITLDYVSVYLAFRSGR